MGQFSVGVTIERPAHEVFDFLSSPASLSRWNSSFESAEWIGSGPPGVGSSYRVVGRILGARKEGAFEIVQWDPPHRYGYRSLTGMFPIDSIESVVTLQERDGRTRVTLDGRFELAGLLRLADGPLGPLAERQDGANLVAAKRLLEGDAALGQGPAFEMSVIIDSPVEDVFDLLADLGNDPRWRREWVEALKTSDGPLGVGTRHRLVGRFLRWHPTAEYELTEYQPDRVAAWRTVTGPLPLTFWRSVEDADGGTRATFGYVAQLHGAAALVGPVIGALGRRALAGDLPTLKALMEAGTSAASG